MYPTHVPKKPLPLTTRIAVFRLRDNIRVARAAWCLHGRPGDRIGTSARTDLARRQDKERVAHPASARSTSREHTHLVAETRRRCVDDMSSTQTCRSQPTFPRGAGDNGTLGTGPPSTRPSDRGALDDFAIAGWRRARWCPTSA